jgi:hypothetical protein
MANVQRHVEKARRHLACLRRHLKKVKRGEKVRGATRRIAKPGLL